MKKISLFLLSIFLSFSLFAEYSDVYSDVAEFFEEYADPNTGLTMFPTLLTPVGGRYEGMGTAFTAVADDPSYFEANPAGGVNLQGRNISFWHKNWIADSSINALSFSSRSGPLTMGAAMKFFHTPFTAYDNLGKRDGSGYFTEGVFSANFSSRILSIGDSLMVSIGAAPKAVVRHVPTSIEMNQSFAAFPLDVGILAIYRSPANPRGRSTGVSIGAAVKNLGRKVFDVGYPLPTVASAGIAITPTPPIVLAIDAHVPISFYPDEYPAQKPSYAGGVSVDITEAIGLHGGFLWKADSPKASIGGRIKYGGADIVTNYNVDFINGINIMDTFSIELSYHSEARE